MCIELHGGWMVNYSRPRHVCVEGWWGTYKTACFFTSLSSSQATLTSLSPLSPVSFSRSCSMPSGTLGTVSFHISLGCLTVTESFTRLLLSSRGEIVDRDGFTVFFAARRGPVDLQSFRRPRAWPPLILVIYIHRHLRRKPLGLVHADSQRDLHRVINSCCPLPCVPLVTGVNLKRWLYQSCENVVTSIKLAALPHQATQSKLIIYLCNNRLKRKVHRHGIWLETI